MVQLEQLEMVVLLVVLVVILVMLVDVEFFHQEVIVLLEDQVRLHQALQVGMPLHHMQLVIDQRL